jgi:hypothetical protein
VDYFTKWPEAYVIRNQQASTVAEALVTNFCRLGVLRELHIIQGRNFESRPIQEDLQRLGVSKMRTTPFHPQSDGMDHRYIKTVEDILRKVIVSNHTDWNARLPINLLPYRASIHNTMGMSSASLVFESELRLPCDMLFRAPPDKERPKIDHAANFVGHLHDIRNYTRQQLKLASD